MGSPSRTPLTRRSAIRRAGHVPVALIVAAIVISSCSSPEERARREPLLPAETFNWGAQPISFQPPPADWRRDRWNQGGRLGADFIHSRSVGERIAITEYTMAGRQAEREGHVHEYSVDDFLDQVRLKPESWTMVDSVRGVAERPDTVAGVPAVTVDFRMYNDGRPYVGREHYLMWNHHLFVAAYLGLEENLPLFERVVETITFPEPEAD